MGSRIGLSVKRTKNVIRGNLPFMCFKCNNHCRLFGSSVNRKLKIPLARDMKMTYRSPGGADGRRE